MSMASRSVFFNSAASDFNRSAYNPIGIASGSGGGGGCDLALIDITNYNSLNIIETKYGANMADNNFSLIPGNDYNQYLELYDIVTKMLGKATDSKMKLLLTIARDTLQGAVNAYTVYGTNLLLNADKIALQNMVNAINSQKNVNMVAPASGQLNVTKKFKLSAVFNYYILIYGLPEPGVGFDANKIKYLVDVLKRNNIDPYS